VTYALLVLVPVMTLLSLGQDNVAALSDPVASLTRSAMAGCR